MSVHDLLRPIDPLAAPGGTAEKETPSADGPRKGRRRVAITAIQVALVVAFLVAWQVLPTISWLSDRSKIFDRFFVSSPTKVADRLYELFTGDQSVTPIWKYIWNTMAASTLGLVIGMVLGGAFGLFLGSSEFMSAVLRPFVVAMNAVPRIALIPIVVLLFGPTFKGSVTVSIMVTFFIAFFNAYEGARSVAPQLIQNATLLGASKGRIMRKVRLPYVVAWTVAALPLAATFSVIAVVTAEFLIGAPGLGRLLGTATSTADTTLTFALVIILSVLGFVTVVIADLISRRVLHWWAK